MDDETKPTRVWPGFGPRLQAVPVGRAFGSSLAYTDREIAKMETTAA